jgi:hypothetical protein
MVYEIQTYNLIGKTIQVFKERPDVKFIEGEHGQKGKFFDEDGKDANISRITKLSTSKPSDALNVVDFPIYLPYFADVTEDLPGWAKWKPKTRKGCQLLTQTHGSYLEFFHHESGETLRIAINSNTYSPVV